MTQLLLETTVLDIPLDPQTYTSMLYNYKYHMFARSSMSAHSKARDNIDMMH